ncbi:hypothetical protein FO519_007072 [Halicephalobus sp. NKZ332]|nr:hypothetical protein FO519_007072 [Halicephalobus sp. NKZ332]
MIFCFSPLWVAINYIFDDYVYNEDNITSMVLTEKDLNYSNTCQKPKIRNEVFMGISMLTIYGITFVTGTFGNSLVLYVIFHYHKMRTVTNLFIANLAVSDLLVSCSSLWITPITVYTGYWMWGEWLCYIFPLFQGTSIFVSTLTLMSIAIDRYFVICHHSLVNANINEHLTMPACIAIIAMIWTISLSLVMPYVVHMKLAYVQHPCNYFMCMEDWAKESLKSAFGFVVLFLQFFFLFSHMISMMCTALNPLVYAWMNENFRRYFVEAVPGLRYVLNSDQQKAVGKKIVTDATPAKNRVSCADNVSGNRSLNRYITSSMTILTSHGTGVHMKPTGSVGPLGLAGSAGPMRSALSASNVDTPCPSDFYHRLGLPQSPFKSVSAQDISGKYETLISSQN